MTDHERLCELLERVLTNDFGTQINAIRDMLTRLRSNGPDGLRVVPVEPTRKMVLAGQEQCIRSGDDDPYRARGQAIRCYHSMIEVSICSAVTSRASEERIFGEAGIPLAGGERD